MAIEDATKVFVRLPRGHLRRSSVQPWRRFVPRCDGVTGYLAVAPSAYAFEIRPANTAQAIATTPAITLVPDRSYSAFVMGQLGDTPSAPCSFKITPPRGASPPFLPPAAG